MKYALYLDFIARAGDRELGRHAFWLPIQPQGSPTPIVTFPFQVEAWKIRWGGMFGLKMTVTLSLGGTISLFQVG